MKLYRVLAYFRWGQLSLEKGQQLEVTHSDTGVLVRIAGTDPQVQHVTTGAFENTVKVGRIEAC